MKMSLENELVIYSFILPNLFLLRYILIINSTYREKKRVRMCFYNREHISG